MSNVPASTLSATVADLEGRMADVMRHTEALTSVLPTAYALPDVTRRALRPLHADLNHAVAQILRVLAPLPENTLWVADLKYRIGILKRDVKEAVAAAEARNEAWQKYSAVTYAGGADAYDANVKLGEINREAGSTCGNLAEQIKQSAAAFWTEGEKARAVFAARPQEPPGPAKETPQHVPKVEGADAPECGTLPPHDDDSHPRREKPPVLLISWREIMEAMNVPSNQRESRKGWIRHANDNHDGPIIFLGRGSQPTVERGKLLDWLAGLEARLLEKKKQADDARASAEVQYPFGADGKAAPELGGGAKRRRSDHGKPR